MLSRARALAKVALATLESTNSTCVGGGRWLSAMPATSTTTAVPEGHRNSDLSNWVCHIGLGRRRDLTLRADLALFRDSHKASLADVFRVGNRGASGLSAPCASGLANLLTKWPAFLSYDRARRC